MINLTRKEMQGDKFALFEAAGISTSGFDYALPQPWVDDMRKMGLENPVAWFIADCSGPCAFPKLRPVFEPLLSILDHRSQSNQELWLQLFQTSVESDASAGDRAVFESIKDNPVLLAECDAGLGNLQAIVEAITQAYAMGRKDMKREMDALVNEKHTADVQS